jgi:hypothetical protein
VSEHANELAEEKRTKDVKEGEKTKKTKGGSLEFPCQAIAIATL